jgi:hypothetical protein
MLKCHVFQTAKIMHELILQPTETLRRPFLTKIYGLLFFWRPYIIFCLSMYLRCSWMFDWVLVVCGVTCRIKLFHWGIFGWSKHDSNHSCSGSWELLIVYGPLKFFHEEMVQFQRRKKKMGCLILLLLKKGTFVHSICT